MLPDDAARIEQASSQVFAERSGDKDAFYGRTKQRLSRLESRFVEWNGEGKYDPSLQRIREAMLEVCTTIPDDSESLQTCVGFLSEI